MFRFGTLFMLLWAVIGCSKTSHDTVPVDNTPQNSPNLQFVLQYGSGYVSGHAVAVDASGQSYVTGRTTGNLAGTGHIGGSDVFIAKYDSAGTRLWIRQFGTAENDEGNGIAVDEAGNSYITGFTEGDLGGSGNAGGADIFIAKFNASGNLLWSKQLGTGATDNGFGIAADSAGTVYIAGFTRGLLVGLAIIGYEDAFVAKVDTDGNPVWINQFGSLVNDSAHGIAIDTFGNSYVTGATYGNMDGNGNAGSGDVFVTKIDDAGQKVWLRQFGSDGLDSGSGIAADANGNSTVAGYTWGGLPGFIPAGGSDAFAAQYDSDGNLRWMEQFGSGSSESANGAAMDAFGHAVITGETPDNLDGSLTAGTAGLDNPFLIGYDSSGNRQWVRLIGTPGQDAGNGVGLDPEGNVYTTGGTGSDLAGTGYAGREDAFVARLDETGGLVWSRQLGAPGQDRAYDVAVDDARGLYMAGSTTGAFREDGQIGDTDVFIMEGTVSGDYLVIQQFGSEGNDVAYGLVASVNGVKVVTGSTDGDMDGSGNGGGTDIFVARRYDAYGFGDWTHQIGTPADDVGYGIALDSDFSTITTGSTGGDLAGGGNAGGNDVFLLKYDDYGTFLWIKQLGSSGNDAGRRVGIDADHNIYVAGTTDGDLAGNGSSGGEDAFLAKFDPDGNLLWIRQFGTQFSDRASDVAVHPFGDSIVTGATGGDLSGTGSVGGEDAFLAKFDPDGNTVWIRQFGTAGDDAGTGVVVDPFGNAGATGTTVGVLAGDANAGLSDAFAVKYDADGALVWTDQLGSAEADVPASIVMDSDGYFEIAGYTAGDLSGEGRAGGEDVFFARLSP